MYSKIWSFLYLANDDDPNNRWVGQGKSVFPYSMLYSRRTVLLFLGIYTYPTSEGIKEGCRFECPGLIRMNGE